jgi:hypothetical protein
MTANEKEEHAMKNTKRAVMMIWMVAVVLAMAMVGVEAKSYVYFGKYMESTLSAYPGQVDGTPALNRAGIRIEEPLAIDPDIGRHVSYFIENETLIDGGNGLSSFTPASTNFKIGLSITAGRFVIIIQHECKHPHEFRSKKVEQYNLIELRYHITP